VIKKEGKDGSMLTEILKEAYQQLQGAPQWNIEGVESEEIQFFIEKIKEMAGDKNISWYIAPQERLNEEEIALEVAAHYYANTPHYEFVILIDFLPVIYKPNTREFIKLSGFISGLQKMIQAIESMQQFDDTNICQDFVYATQSIANRAKWEIEMIVDADEFQSIRRHWLRIRNKQKWYAIFLKPASPLENGKRLVVGIEGEDSPSSKMNKLDNATVVYDAAEVLEEGRYLVGESTSTEITYKEYSDSLLEVEIYWRPIMKGAEFIYGGNWLDSKHLQDLDKESVRIDYQHRYAYIESVYIPPNLIMRFKNLNSRTVPQYENVELLLHFLGEKASKIGSIGIGMSEKWRSGNWVGSEHILLGEMNTIEVTPDGAIVFPTLKYKKFFTWQEIKNGSMRRYYYKIYVELAQMPKEIVIDQAVLWRIFKEADRRGRVILYREDNYDEDDSDYIILRSWIGLKFGLPYTEVKMDSAIIKIPSEWRNKVQHTYYRIALRDSQYIVIEPMEETSEEAEEINDRWGGQENGGAYLGLERYASVRINPGTELLEIYKITPEYGYPISVEGLNPQNCPDLQEAKNLIKSIREITSRIFLFILREHRVWGEQVISVLSKAGVRVTSSEIIIFPDTLFEEHFNRSEWEKGEIPTNILREYIYEVAENLGVLMIVVLFRNVFEQVERKIGRGDKERYVIRDKNIVEFFAIFGKFYGLGNMYKIAIPPEMGLQTKYPVYGVYVDKASGVVEIYPLRE